MPKLRQLNPILAERINGLIPHQPEHMDVVPALQSWCKQDIELTPEQIKKALSAIRQYAIPRTQAFVWRQTHLTWREEAEATLGHWKTLEALLSAAVSST